jgi:alanyl-tRNA synthetase
MDLTPNGDTHGKLVNAGSPQCIEIWNLVFMQFNANPDGTFSPLPAQNVDTGMGFERVASIIQGTKGFKDFTHAKISNYETDIFRPIFDVLEKMSGKTYKSTLPGGQKATVGSATALAEPFRQLAEQPDGLAESFRQVAEQPGGLAEPFCQPAEKPDGLAEKLGGLAESSGQMAGKLRQPAESPGQDQIALDIAFRVIADHIRTLSFAIADGIQPGNNDRNYVLRRILRRAVRYGRTLGFREPFFYKLVDVLADTMGDVFPEIRARKKQVQETIRTEEEAFNKTLDRGIELFEEQVGQYKLKEKVWNAHLAANPDAGNYGHSPSYARLPDERKEFKSIDNREVTGFFAFKLYDTYGFPLDLTELMARERGLTVDVAGFNKLMEEQRARARAAQKKEVISLSQIETTTPTKFVGYENLAVQAKVLEVVSLKDKTAVILDTSACYAEMGGQVGDTGEIFSPVAAGVSRLKSLVGADSRPLLRVTNTQKSGNTWLHFVDGDNLPAIGDEVVLHVDAPRRNAIQRHHTVTHLLHWALHEVASRDASQKGSFVGPDKLTFDFNSAPLTPAQIADIERLVNERIVENSPVVWTEMPYSQVKGCSTIQQFFGEKYGDTVRVLQIGGERGKLNGYSMELCGGTHVRATGEIGLFRIVGENAIAAGVRRIEAVAGLEAYRKANEDLHLIKTLAGRVNSPVHELDKKIEALLAHQKELEKSLRMANQKAAAGRAKDLLAQAVTVNGVPAIIVNLGEADGDTLQTVADVLKSQFKGVVVLGGAANGTVALVAAVSPEFVKRVQAGKIIQQIAPIVGGRGGGKPDNARGGGKDATKLDEALAKAKALLG